MKLELDGKRHIPRFLAGMENSGTGLISFGVCMGMTRPPISSMHGVHLPEQEGFRCFQSWVAICLGTRIPAPSLYQESKALFSSLARNRSTRIDGALDMFAIF